jgi:hypothetical protein
MSVYQRNQRISNKTNPCTADTSEITVGSFLDAVFSVCTNRSRIEGYATAFRKIVGDLFGLATDPAKFVDGEDQEYVSRLCCRGRLTD